MKFTGIVLILAGLVAILCGGFFNTSHSQVPDMGLIQVDDTENHPRPSRRVAPWFTWVGSRPGRPRTACNCLK